MKAVILAGGEGTRLRPLTLATPKPVVPVVDRPLLQHQLDLLATVGVREIVFSVAYRPERVQRVFGHGSGSQTIVYAVEDTPLGTGGAVKNAERFLDARTIVFNGDILTDVDLRAVLDLHERSGASATIVLAPVPNPAAFGLVEADATGRVTRFIEKPDPAQITTNNINAGIYVLETAPLELIPPAVNHSIERGFFPSLIARGDRVMCHVHRGYWIDVGTPEKYLQVHRDILERRFPVALDAAPHGGGHVHPSASLDPAAHLEGPFYVGPRCRVAAGATLGHGSVLVDAVTLASGARVADSVLWAGVSLAEGASVEGALLGPDVKVGRHASVGPGACLGAGTAVTEYSRTR
ncbi:MAG TPA: NDP-sugar synthase [Vicinamibacteria bacterium]|nr:NDP-sugar synthase [Vicinamibacteria bacterium]